MRIGVNAGSLERDLLVQCGEPCPEAMVESAQRHMRLLEDNDFFEILKRGKAMQEIRGESKTIRPS